MPFFARKHKGTSEDYEPDYSGFVDEYRFIPLTPSLADALDDITSGVPKDGNGMPDTDVGFRVTAKGVPMVDELATKGYLTGVTRYIDGGVKAKVSSAGARYAEEYRDYLSRRNKWAHDREIDRKKEQRFQLFLVLLGIIGSMLSASIGYVLGSMQ